jgi:hypothetical protein
MDFGHAVGVAFATGNNRKLKEGEVDETEHVGWGHALIGIAILVIVQVMFVVWRVETLLNRPPFAYAGYLAYTFLPVVLSFTVFWLGTIFTRKLARLPAAFLFVGIALAVLQIVNVVLESFGPSQLGFLIGLRFAVMLLAARGFLQTSWFPSIIIALLIEVTFATASVLVPLLWFAIPLGLS